MPAQVTEPGIAHIARGMGASSGMADEKHTRGVAAVPADLSVHPLDGEREIISTAWIGGFRGKPVFDIHADEALTRKPVEKIVIEFVSGTLSAAHEGAPMDEHRHRRGLRAGGAEDVQHLTGMVAVGEVAQDSDATLGGVGEQRLVGVLYALTVTRDVGCPLWADFGQQSA